MRAPSTTASDFDSGCGRSACAGAISTSFLTGLVTALALLIGLTAAFGTSPAFANVVHPSITAEFGSDGTSATTFGSGETVNQLAYQHANDRVYVFSRGSTRTIHGLGNPAPGSFSPLGGNFPLTVAAGGGFSQAPSFAVDNTGLSSSNNIYYARGPSAAENPLAVDGYSSAGSPLSGFPVVAPGNPCAVAVDRDGYLWVTSFERIDKFPSTGGTSSLLTVHAPNLGTPCGLAFDPLTNDMYVSFGRTSNATSGGTWRYSASSGYHQANAVEIASGAGLSIGNRSRLAINSAEQRIYVGNPTTIKAYDLVSGALLETITVGASYEGMAVDEGTDTLFVGRVTTDRVAEIPAVILPDVATGEPTERGHTSATITGHVGLGGGPNVTDCYFEYGTTTAYGLGTAPCMPAATAGTPFTGATDVTADLTGLTTDTTYHYRLVASSANGTSLGEDRTVTPPSVLLTTEPATNIEPTAATLNGTVNPEGLQTNFYFQYGKSTDYGQSAPAPPGIDIGTTAAGDVPVGFDLEDLEPGATYHFRTVANNSAGTSFGLDRVFTTPRAPSIDSFSSSDVTATTAKLVARINPNGFETTYRFEYGTTRDYGSMAPVPGGVLPAGTISQGVTVPLQGLNPQTYHFRLVAENQWGTTTTENQTFDFNPPVGCPNHTVRQQTGAAYLPDCRAYELVTPGRAGGATIVPYEAPVAPYATGRLAFAGLLSAIPNTGDPPNVFADLYVATRTSTGWATRYVGIPAVQGSQIGMPETQYAISPAGMLTDRGMNLFLSWGGIITPPAAFPNPVAYAPFVWDNEGKSVGRLPTTADEVPGGTDPGSFVGAVQPSADFSHYVFSSRNLAFTPDGLTAAPGSVYDNDVVNDTVTLVSRTANGPIPQDTGNANEYIRIPGVSTDGSHILMSTVGPSGTTHLYMAVDGAPAVDVSADEVAVNQGVKFVGMTSDGSKVFFTTEKAMTAEDMDASVDLYMWSEESGSLTRLSAGKNGAGNADSCGASWIGACNIEVVPTETSLPPGRPQPFEFPFARGRGDVYFYSPEQLEGARGAPGKRNLYVYRNGIAQHVAMLEPSAGVERINVAPDGHRMAFITSSRITSYDNAGFDLMYTYSPETRETICVSCRPDGGQPASDTKGSQNGLFMTDDGRAFFSTRDGLVPRDANGISDVYEYVDGRPQLITAGTGDREGGSGFGDLLAIGLVGVGADGIEVFFSTFDTLVGQDENGSTFKIYAARTNGGFPFTKPPAPCAAADECHGPDSLPPPSQPLGSQANLGVGGNARAEDRRRSKRRSCKKGRRANNRPKRCQRRKSNKTGTGRGQRG